MISENRKKKTEQAENLQSVLGFYPPSISLLCIERNKSPEEKDKQKQTKQILTFLPTAKISFSFARPLASLTQNNSQIALTLMVLSNSDQFLFVLLFTFSLMTLLSSKRDHSKRWNNWSVANAKHASFYREKEKYWYEMEWFRIDPLVSVCSCNRIDNWRERKKNKKITKKIQKYIQPKQLRFLPFSKHINFKRKSEQLKSRCGE